MSNLQLSPGKFSKAKSLILRPEIFGIAVYNKFQLEFWKTIRLFTLDFYDVRVDLAVGLISYHLMEIWAHSLVLLLMHLSMSCPSGRSVDIYRLVTSNIQRLANAGEDDSYLFFSVMTDLKAACWKRLHFAGLSFLASPSIVTVTKSGLFKPLKQCQTVDHRRSQ